MNNSNIPIDGMCRFFEDFCVAHALRPNRFRLDYWDDRNIFSAVIRITDGARRRTWQYSVSNPRELDQYFQYILEKWYSELRMILPDLEDMLIKNYGITA